MIKGEKMSFNIVLVEPEIPQNTGNIARTCVVANAKLHLIKPLGFELDEKQARRAGMDYWKDADVKVYENLDEFFKINKDASTVLKTMILQNRRLFLKKMDFYQSCLKRKLAQNAMILNTEELATVYHFPALKVKTPALTRVLSKKGEPPIGLPIE